MKLRVTFIVTELCIMGRKRLMARARRADFVPTRIVNQRPLVEMIPHDGDNDARNRKNDHPWASC
jgi:hypothetical protein